MVSINDVAKKCGVSKSTVSKALNGTGNLRSSTRDRIKQIAREMNYIPNINAQGLKSKKNYLIGVLFAEKKETGLLHGFYSRLIEHFRRLVSKHGFDIVFMSDNYVGQPVNLTEKSLIRGLDAILLITFDGRKEILDLYRANIPIICTDRSNNYFNTIVSDDWSGARLATEFLITHNHKEIVHIAGPDYSRTANVRIQGYEATMRDHGLVPKIIRSDHYTYEAAYAAMKQLLEESIPHAIFAASDLMAIGAIQAIRDRGMNVPKDISIIGYDGEPEYEFSDPPLTTIRQQYEMMGQLAGERLMEVIQRPDSVPVEQLVDVVLVPRKSVIYRDE
jgi:LacI family transcriptional regulator